MGSAIRDIGKYKIPYFLREIIVVSGLEKILDLLTKGPSIKKGKQQLKPKYDIVINISFNTNKLKHYYSRGGETPIVELIIETGTPDFIQNVKDWNNYVSRKSILNNSGIRSLARIWSRIVTSIEIISFNTKYFICVSEQETLLLRMKDNNFIGWTIPPHSVPFDMEDHNFSISNSRRKKVTFYSGLGIAAEFALNYIINIAREMQDIDF